MKKVFTLLAATTALTACNQEKPAEGSVMTQEQVKLIIDNYVEENPAKILESVNTYMAKAQAEQQQQQAKQQWENPKTPEIDELTPIKGAENAPITIVEYSDFECPFCQKVNPTIDSILEKYKGKVRIAYKHLPLDFHKNAVSAALASAAANEQDKFWEFHDGLFANQTNLNQATYDKIAKELGLDMTKFAADMKSEKLADKVAKDTAEAKSFGIGGTPHFLINGIGLSGAQPESEFFNVIEEHLDMLNK